MPAPEQPRTAAGGAHQFSEVLSEAIARRSVTLDALSRSLRSAGTPVSIATLSYWQTGRSLPTRSRSLQAVDELEKVLRLPVGHLTSALPSDALTRWDPIAELPAGDRTTEVLRSMGLAPEQGYHNETVQDSIVVNAERTQQYETTRQLLRSEVAGLSRIPLVFSQDTVEDVPPSIEAGMGCELGSVVQLEELGMVAAELLLPHPLAVGELAMLEYRLTWDTSHEAEHSFARMVRGNLHYLVLDVTFEGAPPVSIDYYTTTQTLPVDDCSAVKRQPLTPAPFVQFVLSEPPVGQHGLDWEL